MPRHEKLDFELLEEILDTIKDIGHDIRMENYVDAEKKINLLSKLLKVLNDGNRRR